MTVEECHLLKELPRGFGALPALKTFTLKVCNSFLNLSTDFGELTSLEKLNLQSLPLMSRMPDGFGKLKKIKVFHLRSCCQLKTLSDDFENLETLERLMVWNCPELDPAMMEKILKLPNCYAADIGQSRRLLEKWEHMQGEIEHPIVLVTGTGVSQRDKEHRRAIKVALFHGKCLEVKNGSGQLMERSCLLTGLRKDKRATVAFIMLPILMQSHHQEIIQLFVKKAKETAESNGSSKLQIVCARKFNLSAKRPTETEEEERAAEEEDDGIREILLWLPLGSCAIPSSECKRLKILTYCVNYYTIADKLGFFMADVVGDIGGRKIIESLKFSKEDELSGKMGVEGEGDDIIQKYMQNMRQEENNKHYNAIQDFVKSLCAENVRRANEKAQSKSAAGESKTREFIQALKTDGIDYLLADNSKTKVMVDDLRGKAIGFILCDFKFFEWINLQQIYKDLQRKDSNFMCIWIPTGLPEDSGHGSYTRLIQCMPWATFPHPQLFIVESINLCFVVLNEQGHIANHDALPLLLGWGVKSYPFTGHAIPESFSLTKSQSCLEFLLKGMNIVWRKPMTSKIVFLYAQPPMFLDDKHAWNNLLIKHSSKWIQVKFKLEELTQIDGKFEVLYVGRFMQTKNMYDIEHLKQDYEDATQNMGWPSLSFSDMIIFWHRCKYLASEEAYELYKESNIMTETLHRLAHRLWEKNLSVVLLDNHGLVARHAKEVVDMICESSKDKDGSVTRHREDLMHMTGESSELDDGPVPRHGVDPDSILDEGQMMLESLKEYDGQMTEHGLDLMEMFAHKMKGLRGLITDCGIGEGVYNSLDEIWDTQGRGRRMVKYELMKSLKRGQLGGIVRIIFGEEIDDHPQHPQHRISLQDLTSLPDTLSFLSQIPNSQQLISLVSNSTESQLTPLFSKCPDLSSLFYRVCDVCKKYILSKKRSYRCDECNWDMCGNCWMESAKRQVQQLVRPEDH